LQQQSEEELGSADGAAAAGADLHVQQHAVDEAAGSGIDQQQQQQRSRTPSVPLSPGVGRMAGDSDGDSTTSAWTGGQYGLRVHHCFEVVACVVAECMCCFAYAPLSADLGQVSAL
jgi:hypothetical protein